MFEPRRIWRTCLLLTTILIGTAACDSTIYDNEGDCSVHYRVNFRYTKNIVGADAFGPQVTRVHLYVFDKQGRLVINKTAERQPTDDNRFFMEIDVPPGKYDMLAWCEGASDIDRATAFVIGQNTVPTVIDDLCAELPLQSEATEQYSDRDIDRLYHGIAADVVCPDTYGTIDLDPIYLTRDTKHLSVLLQNLDGSPIGENEFSFAIEAANNVLDYRNNVISDTPFNYRPWSVERTSASFDRNDPETQHGRNTRVQTEANGLLAELTTGRLVAGRTPKLVVRNNDGEEVIRIDLIRYLLLVKSKYEGANSDQNYLDRCDDYTLMFFIQNGSWSKAKIYINNWRVVPPQDTEL